MITNIVTLFYFIGSQNCLFLYLQCSILFPLLCVTELLDYEKRPTKKLWKISQVQSKCYHYLFHQLCNNHTNLLAFYMPGPGGFTSQLSDFSLSVKQSNSLQVIDTRQLEINIVNERRGNSPGHPHELNY